MRHSLAVALIVPLLVAHAAAVSAGADEPAHELSGVAMLGRDLYQGRCSNCHSIKPGESSLAPTLSGLMGRKAGRLEGFPYSEKLTRLELVWSAETLDVWLRSQSLDYPILRMRHLGVEDPADRDALVVYIGTLK